MISWLLFFTKLSFENFWGIYMVIATIESSFGNHIENFFSHFINKPFGTSNGSFSANRFGNFSSILFLNSLQKFLRNYFDVIFSQKFLRKCLQNSFCNPLGIWLGKGSFFSNFFGCFFGNSFGILSVFFFQICFP